MNYEPKKCIFCQKQTVQKYGKKDGTQRYKCTSCNKTFSLKKSLNSSQIWQEYSARKQTLKELAERYDCSVKTIQRYLAKAPKNTLQEPKQRKLNIVMDTTFFKRDFGVLVLMDSISKSVIYHHIVKTEKDIYYKVALNRVREKGYIIQSITCDGRRGLLKDLFDTPTQMCQFHMTAIVMRALRQKHKSEAGKELKIIVKTLKRSSKNEFYMRLHHWYQKHKNFLEERSEQANERGYYPYKHRKIRGAYASLKRYMEYLFTYERYGDLGIEKTTNRIEGLFKILKQKLRVHNGLKRKHKIMFIKDFLNKKSG